MAEPFDAIVPPRESLTVRFEGGDPVTVPVDQELGLTLNLIEVAHAIPTPDSQRIEVEMTLRLNDEGDPHRETIAFSIDRDLARRLWEVKDACRFVREGATEEERNAAFEILDEKGFSREADMARRR